MLLDIAVVGIIIIFYYIGKLLFGGNSYAGNSNSYAGSSNRCDDAFDTWAYYHNMEQHAEAEAYQQMMDNGAAPYDDYQYVDFTDDNYSW